MKKTLILISTLLFLTSCVYTISEWTGDGYIIKGKKSSEQFFIVDEPITIEWIASGIVKEHVENYLMTDSVETFTNKNGEPCNYIESDSTEFAVTFTKPGNHIITFTPVYSADYKCITKPFKIKTYVYKTPPIVNEDN